MIKVYCDGSTTKVCFIIEGQKPFVGDALEDGGKVTNNEGEYYALMLALQEAKHQGIKDVELISDSQLIINQLNLDVLGIPIYKAKEQRLRDLRNLVWSLAKQFNSVKYTWQPRNNPAGKVLERIKNVET